MKTTKNTAFAIVSAVVSLVIVGSAFAAFTHSDNINSNFVALGNTSVEISSPTWDSLEDENNNGIPDTAENVWAGKTIAKDPIITNTGNIPSYVYMEIAVPKRFVTVSTDTVPREVQLFNYEFNTENWELIILDKTNEEKNVYLYAYKTPVSPSLSTAPLFSSIAYTNAVQDTLLTGVYNFDIRAYAIQSEFNDNEAVNSSIDAWRLYAEQLHIKYDVVNVFNNVNGANNSILVDYAGAYNTQLIPISGTLTNVSVTMNGTDVTESAYNEETGVINIVNVTGPIIINATAA